MRTVDHEISVANITADRVRNLGLCVQCQGNALWNLAGGYPQSAVDCVRYCQAGHRAATSVILTAGAPGDYVEVAAGEADALARAAGDAAGLPHEDALVSLLRKLDPAHPMLETRRRIAKDVAALGIEVRP